MFAVDYSTGKITVKAKKSPNVAVEMIIKNFDYERINCSMEALCISAALTLPFAISYEGYMTCYDSKTKSLTITFIFSKLYEKVSS